MIRVAAWSDPPKRRKSCAWKRPRLVGRVHANIYVCVYEPDTPHHTILLQGDGSTVTFFVPALQETAHERGACITHPSLTSGAKRIT